MDDDLPVAIPMRCITDHFNCSICLGSLTNAVMTPCGHRFCKECIGEFVDRCSRCPCCNASTKAADLVRDHQIDTFLGAVESEKERAVSSYMDNIFKRSASQPVNGGEDGKALSPFEEVLRKHLKNSLSAHETYLQSLRLLCQRRCTQLDNETAKQSEEVRRLSSSPTDGDSAKLAEITKKCEEQREALSQKLNDITGALAEAFDRYLEDNLPDPAILPVSITLSLPSKDFRAANVKLSPADSCEDLVKQLERLMADAGQRVSHIEDGYRLVLIGPFGGDISGESAESSAAAGQASASVGDSTILAHDCRPLLQYSVKPNSEIRLVGKVVLESELPKKCFAASFSKGTTEIVDYFTCQSCKSNWICQSCAQNCHKGHEVVPYIVGHVARWACCYCTKTKKCTL